MDIEKQSKAPLRNLIKNKMPFSVNDIKAALDGDKKSIEKVVKQYKPLVHMMVNNYKFMSPPSAEDLVQEGMLAILTALKTFNPPGPITLESWMTWVYWKVRSAVQNAARKQKRLERPKTSQGEFKHKEFYENQNQNSAWSNQIDEVCSTEDNSYKNPSEFFDYNMEPSVPPISQIIIDGCGSLDSKKAQIVCCKFGLLGQKPEMCVDIAKRLGMSKQSVAGYLARFSKTIREKHPELKNLISGSN